MESLGFRRPQFSEDLVWLPCWLQQHQLEPLNECINETLDHSKSATEDFALFQGNISSREDSLLSARKEGRFNGCHLFLSGEDNSPISFASSCGNVLHFQLHLSSNGYTQYSETQPSASNAYEAILNSNRVLSLEQLETSVAFREKTSSKMNDEDCGVNILPLDSIPEPVGKSVTQSPSNHKDSTRHYGERFSLKYLKDANINKAVELSTAASEALVIHEIMKSDSESLEAADVLEVALRVKRARLQCLDDANHCLIEETDKNDSLSDLDDSTMADAFEDVGLPFSVHDRCIGSSSISQVKETPVSQNHHECANDFSNLKLSVQQMNFDNVATEKQLEEDFNLDVVPRKDWASESLKQKIVSGNPVLFSTTSNRAIYNDPPATKSPHMMPKTVDFTRVNITSCQPQTDEDSCLHPSNLQNSREDRETYLVERFRSRWLGGWTAVVVDDTAKLKQNTHRSVPKAFAAETSFLSESADVVPDENSFVHIHETQVHGESQSSIPFEGLHDKAVEVILHSQDVVRSSNLSLVDPLCSVVPCSIPSENVTCTIAQNLNYMETDPRKCCSPAAELEMENSPRSTTSNTEFLGPVRRQFTSLKTYSMLFPECVATINGGSLYHNHSFLSDFKWEQLSFNKNMGCIRSCDKRTCKDTSHSCSMSTYTAGIHNEDNCDNLENGITVERIKNQKKYDHETAGEGSEFLQKKQPLILNHRMCRRLQACIPSLYNSIGEEHPKEASIPENTLKLQKNQRLRNIQSDCESSHDGRIPSLNNSIRDKRPKEASIPENVLKLQKNHKLRKIKSNCESSHDGYVPAEKRVRFTEADTQIKQNKILQKLDSSKTNRPTARTSKKPKYSEKWLDHRSHEKSLQNSCFKIGKRLIFQGIEFLLTGFSSEKEKDIEEKIRKHGGIILSDIPSPNSKGKRCSRSSLYQLPVILCLKKLQTTKFLYGCAVNAFILKVDWVTESIRAGFLLLPEKYMILSSRDAQAISIVESVNHKSNNYIFDRVGIMLHGKHNFCTKLAKIIKHGGGQVFKALHWLVNRLDKEKISLGVIVAEDKIRASRHLRQCALERKIPMMPASWIIKSLYLGKLLPCVDEGHFLSLKGPKKGKIPVSTEMSEEI